MTTEPIDAYWFAASDRLPHGDGRKVVVGKSHSLRGEIKICKNALHASRHPFDALQYASGPYLYMVRCSGDVIEHGDKIGCRKRTYIAMIDATDLLRRFARQQALSVIHLWDVPAVVSQYLETGNESLRVAAARAAHAAYAAAAHAAYAAADAAAPAAYAAAADAAAAHAAAARADAADAARAAACAEFQRLVEEAFR